MWQDFNQTEDLEMKANSKINMEKIKTFMKKYGFLFVIAICVITIGTVVGVTVSSNIEKANQSANVEQKPTKPDDKPTKPDDKPGKEDVVEKKLEFCLPSNGKMTNEYSDTILCFNQTLKQYETHQALDFGADGSLNVMAVEDGVVSDVVDDKLYGNYVVIAHKDGYVSKYFSLGDNVKVKKGDAVKKGTVIGEMSTSMKTEAVDGVHLHFEMLKDGKFVNPLDVIELKEK